LKKPKKTTTTQKIQKASHKPIFSTMKSLFFYSLSQNPFFGKVFPLAGARSYPEYRRGNSKAGDSPCQKAFILL
jgi:hypothetical protein